MKDITLIHRSKFIAGVFALAMAVTLTVHAEHVVVPDMPSDLKVEDGYTAYLVGHATGTQNYICLPAGWTLFGPQATLFRENGKQIITHYLSPNPAETGNPLRATWQSSQDSSAVWAVMIKSSSDPAYVAS